jgi:hypothetical protein
VFFGGDGGLTNEYQVVRERSDRSIWSCSK